MFVNCLLYESSFEFFLIDLLLINNNKKYMIENITKAPKATLRLMAETTKIIEIVTKILLIKFNEGIIIFCVTVEQSTEIFFAIFTTEFL